MSNLITIVSGMTNYYRVGSDSIRKGMLLQFNEEGKVIPANGPERLVGFAMDNYEAYMSPSVFSNRLSDLTVSSTEINITVLGPGSEMYLSIDCLEDTDQNVYAGEHLTAGSNGKLRRAGASEQVLGQIIEGPKILPTGIPKEFGDDWSEPVRYIRVQFTGRNQLPIGVPVNQPLPEYWGIPTLPEPTVYYDDDVLDNIPEIGTDAIDMDKPKTRKYVVDDDD